MCLVNTGLLELRNVRKPLLEELACPRAGYPASLADKQYVEKGRCWVLMEKCVLHGTGGSSH